METVCITILTALMIFYAPLITESDCEKEMNSSESHTEFIQYTCESDEFNPLATLLLNPEGNTIRAFMSKEAIFAYNPLLLHFLIWFLMTIMTYGTAVPAGLFLPGILIGCSLGRMLTLFVSTNVEATVQPATYAIIGASAVLAGYSRMTFSLAVIMLETTENVNLFLPIIFTLFISFAVGRLFTRSIYVGALTQKNVPFLVETIPLSHSHLKAKDVMAHNLTWLQPNPTIAQIAEVLRETEHNGFPILTDDRRLLGLISRHTLMTLMQHLEKIPNFSSVAY